MPLPNGTTRGHALPRLKEAHFPAQAEAARSPWVPSPQLTASEVPTKLPILLWYKEQRAEGYQSAC